VLRRICASAICSRDAFPAFAALSTTKGKKKNSQNQVLSHLFLKITSSNSNDYSMNWEQIVKTHAPQREGNQTLLHGKLHQFMIGSTCLSTGNVTQHSATLSCRQQSTTGFSMFLPSLYPENLNTYPR